MEAEIETLMDSVKLSSSGKLVLQAEEPLFT